MAPSQLAIASEIQLGLLASTSPNSKTMQNDAGAAAALPPAPATAPPVAEAESSAPGAAAASSAAAPQDAPGAAPRPGPRRRHGPGRRPQPRSRAAPRPAAAAGSPRPWTRTRQCRRAGRRGHGHGRPGARANTGTGGRDLGLGHGRAASRPPARPPPDGRRSDAPLATMDTPEGAEVRVVGGPIRTFDGVGREDGRSVQRGRRRARAARGNLVGLQHGQKSHRSNISK